LEFLFLFSFFVVLGLELRTPFLLGLYSTTWATLPAQIYFASKIGAKSFAESELRNRLDGIMIWGEQRKLKIFTIVSKTVSSTEELGGLWVLSRLVVRPVYPLGRPCSHMHNHKHQVEIRLNLCRTSEFLVACDKIPGG
jgi:hypothetical protein